MANYEFESGAKRGRNKFIGSWTETPVTPIKLPHTVKNLENLLAIGGDANDSTYSHQAIAQWCEQYFAQYHNDPSIQGKTRDFDIADDVSAQWDMYLANSYTLAELQSLVFSTVELPHEWFADWKAKLDEAPARPPTAAELIEMVRVALWQDWDPIGVNQFPEAYGEYDSYVGGVCSLLLANADSYNLRQHLKQIESDRMGLSSLPSSVHLDDVVLKLLAMVGR